MASSVQSLHFAVRRLGPPLSWPLAPKGSLAQSGWLGARTELPRYRDGILNPELSSNLIGWGMRTELPVQEDDAADWQVSYGEHRREKLQTASFDPGRMVQYVAGRPCAAPG